MIVTLETIEAAFGSVEKWLNLVNGTSTGYSSMTSCALCEYDIMMDERRHHLYTDIQHEPQYKIDKAINQFNDDFKVKSFRRVNDNDCAQCPLAEIAGKHRCIDTPFDLVNRYHVLSLQADDIAELMQDIEDREIVISNIYTPSRLREIVREAFLAEYNFVVELALYLIECYNTGKHCLRETAPQSLLDAMKGKDPSDNILLKIFSISPSHWG